MALLATGAPVGTATQWGKMPMRGAAPGGPANGVVALRTAAATVIGADGGHAARCRVHTVDDKRASTSVKAGGAAGAS